MATAKKSTTKQNITEIEPTIKEEKLFKEGGDLQTEEPIVVEVPKNDTIELPTNVVESANISVSIIKEDMTDKQKVLAYIESRSGSEIKLNDFLKSLFPIPKNNEPAEWLKQGSSKYLKELLSTMQSEGSVLLTDNSHLRLGKCYHKGEQQLTCHYNLNDIKIIAKK